MLFGKMRRTIEHYRGEAAALDPQAFDFILTGLLSANGGTKRGQRTARTDPELAVALFLLEYERETGTPPAEFNAAMDRYRAQAREEGIPEHEVEAFLAFALRLELAEQGVQL